MWRMSDTCAFFLSEKCRRSESSLPAVRQFSNEARKNLAIESLSGNQDDHNWQREGVSRKYLHLQKKVAIEALDNTFAANEETDVLFNLPVTKEWLTPSGTGFDLRLPQLIPAE